MTLIFRWSRLSLSPLPGWPTSVCYCSEPMRLKAQRAGIFAGFAATLVLGFLTSGIGFALESWIFKDGIFGSSGELVGGIITGVLGLVLLVVAGRFFFQPGFQNWLIRLEEQGWFSFTAYKRSQGQRVRRGTIAGILALAGCGVYIMATHGSLGSGGDWYVSVPFTGKVRVDEQNVGDRIDLQNKLTSYKITDQSLDAFRAAQVPEEEVLSKIRTLKDQEFGDEKQLLDSLEKMLDKREFDLYKDQVLKHAKEKKSLVLDRFELRDSNAAFKQEYVKIDKQGDPALVQDYHFGSGEVRTKKEFDEAIKKAQPDKQPTTQNLVLPPGKPEYQRATLLPAVWISLPILLALLTLWFAWRIVNMPTFADFLIATDAELYKVSWTTRPRLVQDTIVVLITVVLLAVFLLVADVSWSWVLQKIGVIQPGKSTATQLDKSRW